jgi:peptidoglycan hydrolase CwlO-like protein
MGLNTFSATLLLSVVGASGYCAYMLRNDIYTSARAITNNINHTHEHVQKIIKEAEEAQIRLAQVENQVNSLMEDKKKMEHQLQKQKKKLKRLASAIQSLQHEKEK